MLARIEPARRFPQHAHMSRTTRLQIKVSPKSSRNAIQGWNGDALKISVTAAPERGKANAAVVALLAEQLGIAKSRISVTGGHTQSRKTLAVEGLDAQALRERLGC